jgi:hypothetical protein
MLWKRVCDIEQPTHVSKALTVVLFLLRNGNVRFARDVKMRINNITELQSYTLYSEDQKAVAGVVRHKAEVVLRLINDEKLLQAERKKAAEVFERTKHIANSSVSNQAAIEEKKITLTEQDIKDEDDAFTEFEKRNNPGKTGGLTPYTNPNYAAKVQGENQFPDPPPSSRKGKPVAAPAPASPIAPDPFGDVFGTEFPAAVPQASAPAADPFAFHSSDPFSTPAPVPQASVFDPFAMPPAVIC